jgi:hypothetical protein
MPTFIATYLGKNSQAQCHTGTDGSNTPAGASIPRRPRDRPEYASWSVMCFLKNFHSSQVPHARQSSGVQSNIQTYAPVQLDLVKAMAKMGEIARERLFCHYNAEGCKCLYAHDVQSGVVFFDYSKFEANKQFFVRSINNLSSTLVYPVDGHFDESFPMFTTFSRTIVDYCNDHAAHGPVRYSLSEVLKVPVGAPLFVHLNTNELVSKARLCKASYSLEGHWGQNASYSLLGLIYLVGSNHFSCHIKWNDHWYYADAMHFYENLQKVDNKVLHPLDDERIPEQTLVQCMFYVKKPSSSRPVADLSSDRADPPPFFRWQNNSCAIDASVTVISAALHYFLSTNQFHYL